MNLKAFAIKLYWKLHKIYAPESRFSQEFYADELFRYVATGVEWLDLGCGCKILPEWFGNKEQSLVSRARHIVGIDSDFRSLCLHSSIRDLVRGDISHLPFKDSSFNLVTANMVMEHLREPAITFGEVHRVLKPQGRFIFITSNTWGYTTALSRLVPSKIRPKLAKLLENRSEEDVFPTLYRVNRTKIIRHFAEKSRFGVEKLKLVTSAGLPQLALYPPFSILELLWITLLESNIFQQFRHNIIAVLRKD